MKNQKTTPGKNTNTLPNERTSKPRTLVVMDTENLIISCQRELGKNYKFEKVDKWIHEQYQVVDKYAFIDICRANGNRDRLDRLGWTFRDVVTKMKDKESKKNIRIKNALDLELALSTFEYILNSNIDRVLLISGDGDFLPLLKRIQKAGIMVDILALESCTSKKLIKFAYSHIGYELFFNATKAVEKPQEVFCCQDCNSQVKKDDMFCSSCGGKFEDELEEELATA